MTSIAMGALVLGGLTSLGVASASAATPTITVTPNTGLVNGQSVTVAGTGFQSNETLYALECINAGANTNETDCDLNTVSATTTSATGTFSTSVTVVTGTVAGTSKCGTSSTDASNCAIAVSTNPPSSDAALMPITFAVPTTPTTTTTTPATTTTTLPAKIGPRQFHVSPVSGLMNGTRVKVWGTGFKPGDQVYVVECLVTAKSQSGCDLHTLHPVRITAKGVLPLFRFKVVTGRIGTGFCGTKPSNLKSCSLSVANALKGDAARVRIQFK